MNIRTKQFHILTDIELVWQLMTDVYNHEETNGPAAPYFEYAIISSWMDKEYVRYNRFWLDGDTPVGFVFYEQDVNVIHFVTRPGYECLAAEMIDYVEGAYPKMEDALELVFCSGQTALMAEAEKRGYKVAWEEHNNTFDFSKGELEYPLPAGYHFVEPKTSDSLKVAKCLWDGFNSEEYGPFVEWEKPGTPAHGLYHNVLGATVSPSPHATYDLNVIIADEKEEYVCFAGMWWVPENKLGYLEPLCTVPAHQHKGLAQAALSQHYKTLKKLGAEILTGGGNKFYKKIGYQCETVEIHMRKQ